MLFHWAIPPIFLHFTAYLYYSSILIKSFWLWNIDWYFLKIRFLFSDISRNEMSIIDAYLVIVWLSGQVSYILIIYLGDINMLWWFWRNKFFAIFMKLWRFHSVVVITSALHAEGPQFDPGWKQFYNFNPSMEFHFLLYFLDNSQYLDLCTAM